MEDLAHSASQNTHRDAEYPVDDLGYPMTPMGMVMVARRVLRDIPRPQEGDGTMVVYRVSDDVPEDITVALSYLEAAIEAGCAGMEPEGRNEPNPTAHKEAGE